MTDIEHIKFPSITRLNRLTIVSEKLDGGNVGIHVMDDGRVVAQSRKIIITPDNDFKGFARWVAENEDDLRTQLGFGLHFGEWWGQGVQKRNYDLTEKRFSLFNSGRWHSAFNNAVVAGEDTEAVMGDTRCIEAPLVHVVPIIATGTSLWDPKVIAAIDRLKEHGSFAAPGFMRPEGIVVFHDPSQTPFKVLCENDHMPKSLVPGLDHER